MMSEDALQQFLRIMFVAQVFTICLKEMGGVCSHQFLVATRGESKMLCIK